MHILITTNNFWVGGRETYIAEYVSSLKKQGYKFSLITSSLVEGIPQITLFDEVLVCGISDYANQVKNWLVNFNELLVHHKIDLIWAHHYDLLPAWIISRRHNIPLVTTFHGPLIGDMRSNHPMQALGMVLAIHRGDAVSGVSQEITSGIQELNQEIHQLAIFPNAKSIDKQKAGASYQDIPRKFVLITRTEKLGHIRKSLLFLQAYRKKRKRCTLTIVTGRGPEDLRYENRFNPITAIENFIDLLSLIGAKWCYQQGISLWSTLFRTHLYGYADDSSAVIQEADVVLGMGRVIIEGLSQGKPSILIGYDDIHGVVTDRNFDNFRWSNFSGRNLPFISTSDACDDLMNTVNKNEKLSHDNLQKISISYCGKQLEFRLSNIVKHYNENIMYSDFAKKLEENILANNLESSTLFPEICKNLTFAEMSSFYRLSTG